MLHGHNIIHDLTGDFAAYPGHPLVLAVAIMKIFTSYAAANAMTEHGWCEALSDSRVPGAGDHVGAAIRLLSKGAEGASADEMILYGREYWTRGNAGGHVKNVQAGLEQARKVEPAFREAVSSWFASPAKFAVAAI